MPPDYPGIPGLAIPKRPAPSNPPPEDLEADRPSVIEFKESLKIQHGKLRIVIPWVVVAAALTFAGTYLGAARTRAVAGSDETAHELQKINDKIDKNRADQDLQNALMLARQQGLETQYGTVQADIHGILIAVSQRPTTTPTPSSGYATR